MILILSFQIYWLENASCFEYHYCIYSYKADQQYVKEAYQIIFLSPIQKPSTETAMVACSISWPIWLVLRDMLFRLMSTKTGYSGRDSDNLGCLCSNRWGLNTQRHGISSSELCRHHLSGFSLFWKLRFQSYHVHVLGCVACVRHWSTPDIFPWTKNNQCNPSVIAHIDERLKSTDTLEFVTKVMLIDQLVSTWSTRTVQLTTRNIHQFRLQPGFHVRYLQSKYIEIDQCPGNWWSIW